MMNKTSLLSALLLSISLNVSAKSIQYVSYNKDVIPNIITATGIASEIIFEEDETIEYATFGFDAAWENIVVRNHILVFKAKDEQPETNLIVHTNKRDYLFTLTTGNNDWEDNPKNSGATYSVRMVYHDDKSKAALAAKSAKSEQKILRNVDISPISTYLYSNYDYRATSNAYDIVPYRVWDNGVITFIAFNAGSKRGVAYELDSQNRAHLINQHTEKNGLLVLHGIYPHIILRLNDQAVELRRNNQTGQSENNQKTNVAHTFRFVQDSAPTTFKQPPKTTANNPQLLDFTSANNTNDQAQQQAIDKEIEQLERELKLEDDF